MICFREKQRWAMIGYRHEFPIEKIYIVIEIRKNELISTEVDILNKYIAFSWHFLFVLDLFNVLE